MTKYHLNIRIDSKENNAGTKATEDCKTILLKRGYIDIEIHVVNKWYYLPLNVVKLAILLFFYVATIKRDSLILVQYPLRGINQYFKKFIGILKKKGCKFSCIIHDLDCIRSPYDKHNYTREVENLSAYNAVISHNPSMTSWLTTNGYRGFIAEINLFDYLVPKTSRENIFKKTSQLQIAFAGNLGRGNFLHQLPSNSNIYQFKLYGPNFNHAQAGSLATANWSGNFSPDEIVNKIDADYGLIWDGDSSEDLQGLMGEYLMYNTPHKTSLYLVAGMPVIVSNSSAIAAFVESNNIGFTINSLADIEKNATDTNSTAYQSMKKNVEVIAEKLQVGGYLNEVLNKVENFLFPEYSSAA